MNRSHTILAVVLAFTAVLVLLRLPTLRPDPAEPVKAAAPEFERAGRRSGGAMASPSQRTRPDRALRSRAPSAETTGPETRSRRELTGYLVDEYRSWDKIPHGYQADGLRLESGGVTLESEPSPEQTASGTLLSPPLPLRPPPGGRPATPGRELPPGSSVELEIRLSRNGSEWSGWNLVDRDRGPDGPLVAAPPSPGAEELQAYRDATTTGPSIQYRLTLRAGPGAAPTIRELRIWHDGPARPENELSIHSAPMERE